MALDVIASNETQVLKVIHNLDLTTDGAKTAAALHKHAEVLRKQVTAEDSFDYAEMVVDQFTHRERTIKQALRGVI